MQTNTIVLSMDTIPNEFNDEKSEQSNLNSNNNEEKSNKIMDVSGGKKNKSTRS